MKGLQIHCVSISLMVLCSMYAQNVNLSVNEMRLVPSVLNYQGYLTDTLGIPVNGTLSMRFQIYDAASGGDDKWSEIQNNVVIEDGIFHVLLGSVVAIPDSVFKAGADRWLQLMVEGQTLTPRTRITSVGYAYTSTYSDTALYAHNASSDNDWSYETPDSLVLFTARQLGVARGGSNNALYGLFRGRHNNFGYACTTGISTGDYIDCSVNGGAYNVAGGNWSVVGGGSSNKARGDYAVIAGGSMNHIASNSSYSCVCGGARDTILGSCSGILSGYSNKAGDSETYDSATVIAGGRDNGVYGKFSFIGGGRDNTLYATYSGIVSGDSNAIGTLMTQRTASFIAGGHKNRISANHASILGGRDNYVSGDYGSVVGGCADTVRGKYSSVLSGYGNQAGDLEQDSMCAIVGGGGNFVEGSGNFIGSGTGNTINGRSCVIVGGEGNYSAAVGASIAGGFSNTCNGDYCFVAGYASGIVAGVSNCVAFNGQSLPTGSGITRVGTISKASGTFTIDHPLDPDHKILNHYFVESPEMVNVYRGTAVLDDDGRAEVILPAYFDALNADPHITLTGVQTYEVFVAEKVKDNRFVIGGKPGTEVFWTVTGARKDMCAEITKIMLPVEQDKEGDFIGHSINDDFLAATKSYLEKRGRGDDFEFRTAEGRQRYEGFKKALAD